MKWPKILGRTSTSTGEEGAEKPEAARNPKMFRNLNPLPLGIELPFAEILPLAAEFGFPSIELPLPYLLEASREQIQEAKRALVDSGLRAACFPLPVEFREDNETFNAGMAKLDRAASIASEFGCIRCYTWITPYHDELTFPENFERHRDRLSDCARVLDSHGARLGLEYVAPLSLRKGKNFEFIHDLRGLQELIKLIDLPNVGLLLDSFHWYTSGGTLEEILALKPEQIVYVHINDAPEGLDIDEQADLRRCLPGETGVIQITEFLNALETVGYAGPVAVEPFLAEFRQMEPREVLAKVRDALDRVGM